MKSFDEILSSGVLNLSEIENFRQEQEKIEKAKQKKGLIISGIILFITCLIAFASGLFPLLIIVLIVGIIAYLIWWGNVKNKYIVAIKENLIQKLIKSIDESFGYQPNAMIPKDVFKESNLIKTFNQYSGEDYFFGRIDDIPIEFSQLLVKQKHDKSTVTLFNGTFFVAEFKQHFQGRAAVVPDTMEKTFGAFGRVFQKITIFRDNLIKINDTEFEKQFAIYSTNEQEANKLLQGNLNNYLLQLKAENPSGVFFAYNKQKFYLGLYSKKDIFKVDINNQIDANILREYYDEIVNSLNIVINIYAYLEENMAKSSYQTFDY